MNIKKPNSGFLVFKKNKDLNLHEIMQSIRKDATEVIAVNNNTVVFAVFKEFEDQGLWSDSNHAVAYDIDLTNETYLLDLLKIEIKNHLNKGKLLWLLYKKFGIEFVDKLRGTFAFSIWDNDSRELFVITDPYGIKSVVYSESSKGFSAATRIRHLLAIEFEKREINPDAIFHYLFFQAICSPLTIYQGINKLEPGKGIQTGNKGLKIFTYYDIKYNSDKSLSEKEWKLLIREKVQEAVNVFVPLSSYDQTGCFLSGGTDSSSIAGFYTKLAGKPAKTFSIGFDDPKYNELDYARIAANHFNTDYHEYYVTPQDVLNLIEELSLIYDEPFGNASVIPSFYCAKVAKENGVNILLGGDGGDEIFGGNERYVSNLIFQQYIELPDLMRKKMIEPLLTLMPDIGVFHKAKRYIRRANLFNPERFFSYNLLSETDPKIIFQNEFLSSLNLDTFINIAKKHYQTAAPAHDTDRLLYLDMKFTITDNDVRKVTQMVETAGIKVRYPFLDRDLVDFTTTIPPSMKVKWKNNRYIFKQAMKGFLPDEIIYKSKHGMGLPVTPWFKKDKQMNTLLYDMIFTGTPRITQYVKPGFIDRVKNEFKNDTTSYYGDNLWIFLILELWLSQSDYRM